MGGVHYLNSAVDTTLTEFAAQCAAFFDKSKALKLDYKKFVKNIDI